LTASPALRTMHEIEPPGAGEPGRVPVLEIQIRRGICLGRSDSMDDTSHLLPQGPARRCRGHDGRS